MIEDDGGMRKVLCEALEEEGFEILAASEGVAGLMLMESRPADPVITGMNMPEMAGNEAILTLRRDYPEIPIIAMTGGGRKAGMSFLKIAEKQCGDRVIEKPFRTGCVIELVRGLLAQRPRAAG